jgi:hypothetical protein
MKEPHIEGLANHDDRESCASDSNIAREALTAVCTGWVLSPENRLEQGADAVIRSGRQHFICRYCKTDGDPAWSKTPYMYRNCLHGNREILGLTMMERIMVRVGNPKGESR